MIGAGAVNFGSREGPWNHSARLQQLPGVIFSAVVDPDLELATQRVAALAQGIHTGHTRGRMAVKPNCCSLSLQGISLLAGLRLVE